MVDALWVYGTCGPSPGDFTPIEDPLPIDCSLTYTLYLVIPFQDLGNFCNWAPEVFPETCHSNNATIDLSFTTAA